MKKFLSFIILLIVTNIYLGYQSAPGHLAAGVFYSHVDEALQKTTTPSIITLLIQIL
ncbi:MAG TPA: hypothetical protein VKA49_13415 [Flavitalea sp.]|nr:hypothetical protein [Flavitalea sp.]